MKINALFLLFCLSPLLLPAQSRMEIRDYTFKDMRNKNVHLKDYKGKVVVLDFWASWCQPCLVSFPTTTAVMQEFEGQNVVLLTIGTDKGKRHWKQAVNKHKPPGIALYAKPKHPALTALAVQYLPRYVILDKKGQVYSHEAASPYEEKEAIRKLLAE